MGPRTGRGAGWCAGYPAPGYLNPIPGGRGRGWGGGRGGGRRGWRHRYDATGLPGWMRYDGMEAPPGATSDAEMEKQMLTRQVEFLRAQLDRVTKRLDALTAAESQAAKS
jgi:hypothetical protein